MKIPKTFKLGCRTFRIEIVDDDQFANEASRVDPESGMLYISNDLSQAEKERQFIRGVIYCIGAVTNSSLIENACDGLATMLRGPLQYLLTENTGELPHKMSIGGIIFTISRKAIIDGAKGYARSQAGHIVIEKNLPYLRTVEVFLHECVHASSYLLGEEELWRDEHFTQTIALLLAQALATMK